MSVHRLRSFCRLRDAGRRFAVAVLIICICIGVVPAGIRPAHGYVLEGPYVLEMMIETLSGPETLRVDQLVVIDDQSLSEQPLQLTEIANYRFPDRFRSDTWFQNTHRVLVVSAGQALTVIDGRITGDQESRFDVYKDLLLYHSRPHLLKALFKDHVDVGKTSLGRFDNRIVIVIGAQYPDESVSQVWVDKERFLPLRWISYGSGSGPDIETDAKKNEEQDGEKSRLEFVYRNWRQWGKVWWPSRIESYSNQQLIRQMRIRKVEVNIPVPEQMVTIAHLKSMYDQAEPVPRPPSPKTDVDEVQETIDEFKKKFQN